MKMEYNSNYFVSTSDSESYKSQPLSYKNSFSLAQIMQRLKCIITLRQHTIEVGFTANT